MGIAIISGVSYECAAFTVLISFFINDAEVLAISRTSSALSNLSCHQKADFTFSIILAHAIRRLSSKTRLIFSASFLFGAVIKTIAYLIIERIFGLLPYNLYHHSFLPLAVKLAVKDLFPRPKIQSAFGYSYYGLTAHDGPFKMRICIVFARQIMAIARYRFMWSEPFKPFVKISMEAFFVVIYKYACGYMHCVYKTEPFLYAAFPYAFLYRIGYIDKFPL